MKMLFALLFSVQIIQGVFGQGLENVLPVFLCPGQAKNIPDISFILTPVGRLEIIDAKHPWPPRWFAPTDYTDTTAGANNHVHFAYMNARMENGYFAFYQSTSSQSPRAKKNNGNSFIVICNDKFEELREITGVDTPINSHDFAVNNKMEVLLIVGFDTVLNISGHSGNKSDTAVKALIDILEIISPDNKLLYRWNPTEHLGLNTLYFPYANLKSLSSKEGFIDWSHANAIDWDYDGNILYCFRHIGVGKVSRATGNVLWHIDRNNIPYTAGNDTFSFYLQHGFKKSVENRDYFKYTMLSNGDSLHPRVFGVEIDIDKKDESLVSAKTRFPDGNIYSFRAGNYEVLSKGNYIMSYGNYTGLLSDTAEVIPFMEYGSEAGKIYARYCFKDGGISYATHTLAEKRPPRPEVIIKNKQLLAKGDMNGWTWYILTGTDNMVAEKVAEGTTFAPTKNGLYCVTGKYGIGYSVSLPVLFKK